MLRLKLAIRALAKTPFITALAVLSLALGIGANTAIYSLFDQMLLRSLPVREPEHLVNLSAPGPKPGSQSCNQAGDCDDVFSYAMFRDLEQADGPFSGVAAHRRFSANLAFEGRTLSATGLLVSGSYFPVLGVRPALGRLFDPADDRNPGEQRIVVLSHDYWESKLASDPGVLNRTLVVNGTSMTVVGVAPRGFTGTTMGMDPDIYVPLSMRTVMEPLFGDTFEDRRSYWAYLFARLKPGVSMERATEEANNLYHGIIDEVEAPLQHGMSQATLARFREKELLVRPGDRGQSSLQKDSRAPLTLLLCITGVVLLIACANIANLLLARGAARTQEMAIRSSLGARRGRLVGELLLESLVLAFVGGVASLLVAHWTLAAVGSMIPAEQLGGLTLRIRPPLILFTAALVLGTGILFGLFPTLHATRGDLVTTLKGSSGQPSGARAAARFRTSLVTAQIALSMTLLVAAGLFVRSLVNLSRVDLGLDTRHTVVFGVSPVLNGYQPEERMALFQRAEAELAAIPGVTGVTAATVPVLGGSSWGNDVSVEGFEGGPDVDQNARYNEVGPRYFSTLGMPLLGGREFDEQDGAGAPEVAVVNEAFARKFNLDPRRAVGRWMSRNRSAGADDLDIQIIGVVQDAKYNDVKEDVPPLYFIPYRQDPDVGFIYFYLRTSLDPSQVMRAVPGVFERLDADLPVEDLKTLDQQARESVNADRMISMLSTAFAVLATLLAAVGLYGVVTYTVARRTREIGLRMALGAGAERVRGMVLRQVTRMLMVGGILGLGAGLALGRAARSLLFGLEGTDPWVVGAVSLILTVVALGAGYLPARRASRVDPMQALRYE